jgi:hypothetical protein
MATAFDRPIPGQSLTDEPRNNPWEQPPEMANVEDVAKYYIERLANQDVLDDFAAMCQAGASLAPIVESTYLQGVMRGLHTLDAGMLVAPIIHTFLKQSIEAMGVTVKDTGEDPQKKAEEAEMNRFNMILASRLAQPDVDTSDPGIQMLSEMAETEEPVMDDEQGLEQEDKPMGLMAKG